MDLGQLRTLIYVAELGSLNKAADRLRIAQPALSRQIRLLEEELGTRLFTRHGRGMVITEAGEKVLARAAAIMREVEEIRAEAAADKAELSGQVVLGMPPTVGEIITVPLARAFQAAHPRVRLRFVPAFTGHLLEWLQRGDVDLAVLYDPKPLRSLRTRPFLIESLFAVGGPSKDFSLVRALPFRTLAEEPLLLPSPRHGLRALVESVARDAGIPLDIHTEADSLATLKDLVLAGLGATILPLAAVHPEIVAGRLKAAPITEPALTRRLVLASSSDRPLSRAARELGDTLMREVAGLVERGIWVGHLVDS